MQDNSDSPTPTTAVSTVLDAAGSIDVPGHNRPDTTVLPHTITHPIQKIQEKELAVDIEHVFVQDDPREWTKGRKTFTLATIAISSLIAILSINIYNPAIPNIKEELHASDQQISLSLSLAILVQGSSPLLWSALSEIRGRKVVYLVSICLFVIACGVAGSSHTINILIGMRILQSIGASALLTTGAATLADIYEPHERGGVVGIYYAAPVLGTSLGPLVGGIATQLFSWRATFYFLCIFGTACLLSFVFFKDTFRRERSLSYQVALRRATKQRTKKFHNEARESHNPGTSDVSEKRDTHGSTTPDLETQPQPSLDEIKLSIKEINPIRPMITVLRRKNNVTVLFASSVLYAFTYCISYTVVRTLAAAPYEYNSLKTGLVLLSLGFGSMGGSVIGGKWSDYSLRKYRLDNGKTKSEDRLQSTKAMMLVLPLSLIAYAWMAEKKVDISGPCIALFFAGFSSNWIYSSTLAYLVDVNPGRSSTAAACNALFRGTGAFIAGEIAVPLQNGLGDGGLYTLWAGIVVVTEVLIIITIHKGGVWRETAEEREAKHRDKA